MKIELCPIINLMYGNKQRMALTLRKLTNRFEEEEQIK